MSDTYLPEGLPRPEPDMEGLDTPFWTALADHRLVIQRCSACHTWQWGPEWICHACGSSQVAWAPVEPRGTIYSWERVWHPVHPALRGHTPYLVILVEIAGTDGVRMLGNLLGDPMQDVPIGAPVVGLFEERIEGPPLVQWRRTD